MRDEDKRQKRNVTLMLLLVYTGRLFERCFRGKMLHGSSKGCFYCVWTDLWRYMGVHQREGAIGSVGALGCLIPCVYGLSGAF